MCGHVWPCVASGARSVVALCVRLRVWMLVRACCATVRVNVGERVYLFVYAVPSVCLCERERKNGLAVKAC